MTLDPRNREAQLDSLSTRWEQQRKGALYGQYAAVWVFLGAIGVGILTLSAEKPDFTLTGIGIAAAVGLFIFSLAQGAAMNRTAGEIARLKGQ